MLVLLWWKSKLNLKISQKRWYLNHQESNKQVLCESAAQDLCLVGLHGWAGDQSYPRLVPWGQDCSSVEGSWLLRVLDWPRALSSLQNLPLPQVVQWGLEVAGAWRWHPHLPLLFSVLLSSWLAGHLQVEILEGCLEEESMARQREFYMWDGVCQQVIWRESVSNL